MFDLPIDYVDKTIFPVNSRMIEISEHKGTRLIYLYYIAFLMDHGEVTYGSHKCNGTDKTLLLWETYIKSTSHGSQ